MKHRLLFLVAIFMISATTFAQFSGSGSGTENDPYLIFNPIQLDQVRNFLGNNNVYFKIMADIDLEAFIADNYSTQGWLPIGTENSPFQGHFDGNGKTISNLTINRPTTNNVGFFGYIGTGVSISNITLIVNIIGANYTGGLIGSAKSTTNNGVINNVFVKGTISGNDYVGGLIGYGRGMSRYINHDLCFAITVESSSVDVSLEGKDYVGGLVSYCQDTQISSSSVIVDLNASGDYCGGAIGYIDCSFLKTTISTTNISGSIVARNYAGGVVGYIAQGTHYNDDICEVFDCYFNGTLAGNDDVGGVCGYEADNKIYRNYSVAKIFGQNRIGGILGTGDYFLQQNVAINNSVTGTATTGRIYGSMTSTNYVGEIGTSTTNKALATTKVTVNGIEQVCEDNLKHGQSVGNSVLKYKATYQGIGWDFTNTWDMQETESYPYFTWQTAPPIINNATSGETTVSGQGTSGAIIRVTINGREYQTVCANNVWSVTTETLIAGSTIFATATSSGKSASYRVSATVSYLGQGTEVNPYHVYSAQELANIKGNGHFKLMNDIDISSINPWSPIGQHEIVSACLDGDNHTISGLTINSTKNCQGLFAQCNGSTLKNINLSVSQLQGGNYVGALAGWVIDGQITNCHITGNVIGGDYTGGLVGYVQTSSISQCSVIGNVMGTAYMGGLVAYASGTITKSQYQGIAQSQAVSAIVGGVVGLNNATITECCSSGNAMCSQSSSIVGGLVGKNTETGTITNCFSASEITSVQNAGGLVGRNFGSVTKCYACGNLTSTNVAAGLVGYNDGLSAVVNHCCAMNPSINATSSTGIAIRVIGGLANNAPAPEMSNYALNTMAVSINGVTQRIYDDNLNGVAKTEAQLKQQTTYQLLGWDFSNVWGIEESQSYPFLRHFTKSATITFLNYDGSILQSSDVIQGRIPTYNGEIPTKPGDAQISYVFTGWTPEIVPVDSNATYTATFTPVLREYTITWKNDDGTIIDQTNVAYGAMPEYRGATPSKVATVQYSYSFAGWSPSITSVTGDATYTATYASIVNKYVVTFVNEDNTLLQRDTLDYGAMPVYRGDTPTKMATAQYSYTFAGWSTAIAVVMGNTTYKATYASSLNKYVVMFLDEDGTTILQRDTLDYGTMPAYRGATPSRMATAQYSYTFAGWSPSITSVTGDATYTATYASTLNKYLVTFLDEDGTTILQRDTLDYGTMPAYRGDTPSKPATAQYSYTFAGWSPTIESVTGNATYTATYASTLNKYVVTFFDEDSTIILQRDTLDYGTMPAYRGATPSKMATAQYSYTFAGWSPSITSVIGNATYTATYASTLNKYVVTFLDEDGTTLLQRDTLDYGSMPAYRGGTPSKAATAQYSYSFSGWSPAITSVSGNATYTATYASTLNKYVVTFLDEDGTTLLQRDTLDYGAMPAYRGGTPSKPATAQYSYTFSGWSPAITSVSGNASYTATYASTLNKYVVTFLDEDGTTLLQRDTLDYGSVPAYRGGTPSKTATAQYSYTFSGWSPAIESVSGNATYSATYASTLNKYVVTFLDEDNTLLQRDTLDYGSMPAYRGSEPQKPSDGNYSYTFNGWQPEIVPIVSDATYVATYNAVPISALPDVPDSKQPRKVWIDGKMYIIFPDGSRFDSTGKRME